MTTTNKGLNQPVLGSTGWGTPLNDNAAILDKAFGSFTTIASVSGTTNLTATDLQNMCIKSSTSTFTANVVYRIPAGIAGQWVVQNQSLTSAFTLTVNSLGGGTSVTVGIGETRSIYCDGTNVVYADTPVAFTPVQQGGGAGQTSAKIYMGASATGVAVQSNTTDLGDVAFKSDVGTANSALVKTALNAAGDMPIFACRAWANFNGTNGNINGAGNVASVTKLSTGTYRVNFSTNMVDANYAVNTTGNRDNVGTDVYTDAYNVTVSGFSVKARDQYANTFDITAFYCSVFR